MIAGVSDTPPRHFRSICSVTLTRKFVHKFLQYFFDNEDVTCGCTNGNTPLKMPSPFSRSDETIHFFFAYKNTGINFRADTYNFMADEE